MIGEGKWSIGPRVEVGNRREHLVSINKQYVVVAGEDLQNSCNKFSYNAM